MASCSVLTSESDVQALADDWRALQDVVGKVPFTNYDWVMAWWRLIGQPSGATLAIVACHEAGRLVGVLPLIVNIQHGVRVMHLVGHDVYYYRAFLIAQPHFGEVLWRAALSPALCDIAYIKNIHEDTVGRETLAHLASPFDAKPVYYATLTGGSRTQILATFSKNFRRKLKKANQLRECDKSLSFKVVQNDAEAPVVSYMATRKLEWTKEREKRGLYLDPNAKAYMSEMARVAAREGRLVIFFLEKDGQPVGGLLTFAYKKTLYCHTQAFDLSLLSITPGHFLNTEAMVWASENGFDEINFMEGAELYKQHYTDDYRMASEYIFVGTLVGRLHLWLYWAVCALRAMRERFMLIGLKRKSDARLPAD